MAALKRKHLGAFAEHRAICWLLEQGYEVFHNVSPHGAVDMIAIHPQQMETSPLLIDVKTASRTTRLDGSHRYGPATILGADPKIEILLYIKAEDRFIWQKDLTDQEYKGPSQHDIARARNLAYQWGEQSNSSG